MGLGGGRKEKKRTNDDVCPKVLVLVGLFHVGRSFVMDDLTNAEKKTGN